MKNNDDRYLGMNLVELVHAMADTRSRLEDLKERVAVLQQEFDYLSKTLVPNAMEEAGLEQVTVTGIGRVNLRADIYASIPADCKQEAYQWLIDNGRSNLITETVNASTLKASIREAIRRGEEFPQEFFKVTPYTSAVITKKA